MPNVLLLVSPEATDEVAKLMPELGPTLREATAKALGDIEPKHVAVMAVNFFAGDNATPMQILAIGSANPERLKKLQKWAVELAKAWRDFATYHNIPWRDKVDVWPIMPEGRWMLATPDAIRRASE